ncbi:MAG: YjgP/YjgQ family permease [Spirochaetes bacterium]|nr:MAG: YjgP/YjgQ family permease [Spirochaetota bacterium]
MARTYRSIYFYIGKEFLISFLVAFLFFFFIFFVNQLLFLAEDILSKRAPLIDVFLLVIFSLPLIISLSFPFGALVGALMAVGRLSSDNEILALRASGVSLRRIFLPLISISLIFSVISFFTNDYFLPRGTVNFGKLYRELIYSNPGIELESYTVKHYQDSIIITGKVSENQINNIMIIDRTEKKERRIIKAAWATFNRSMEQEGIVSLELENVFIHTTDNKKKREFEYIESERMIYNILLKDISFSIRNPGPAEMSSLDVYKVIDEKEKGFRKKIETHKRELMLKKYNLSQEYFAARELLNEKGKLPDKNLNRLRHYLEEYLKEKSRKITDRILKLYKLEFHKKLAVPFACFFFMILAFPVGLFTRRSGRAVGFGIGLFVSIIYWGMLFAGQTFGLRMDVSPVLSMWMPNIVIFLTGVIFIILRAKR